MLLENCAVMPASMARWVCKHTSLLPHGQLITEHERQLGKKLRHSIAKATEFGSHPCAQDMHVQVGRQH